MAHEIINPFAQLELQIPEALVEDVKRYTGTHSTAEEGDIDKKPFDRYIDLWWAGLCIGVADDHKTKPDKWHKFIEGNILNSDPWRIHHLEMLAIAWGGPEALKDPAAIIRSANEYAAHGIGVLVQVMSGQSEPIWAVSRFLQERLGAAVASPAPRVETEVPTAAS